MTTEIRRLPLEGLKNCRELGGYPIVGGGVTKFRQFLRSEVPQRATESDLEFLRAYGVRTSIDFLGESEAERHPNRLSDKPWVKFVRCPSFNRQVAGERGVTKHMPDEFINWGDFYIGMLKNSGDWIKSVLETMAASEGTVMYNCATGKDRVGIMSAMLLGIAGVGEDDIIADYCMSMVYLRSVYKYIVTRLITLGEDGEPVFDAPFFRTDPVNMERPLDFIRENFGSVESYVLSLGTDKGAVDEIKRRLAGK